VAKLQRQEQMRKDRQVGILAEGERRTRRTVLPTSGLSNTTTLTSTTTRKPRAAAQKKRAAAKAVKSDEESFEESDSDSSAEVGGNESNDYGSDQDSEKSDGSDDSDEDRPKKKKIKPAPSPKKKKVPKSAVESPAPAPKPMTAAQHRTKQEKDEREYYIADRQAKLRSERSEQAKRRLQFLLKQSDIFSHFGNVKEDKTKLLSRSRKKIEDDSKDTDSVGEGGESIHRRKDRDSGNTKPNKDATHDEEEEDLANPENSMAMYLTQQPSDIGFGTMRAYQLEGLNWMIRLQENGVNGILADEMGLGKTLQSISILVYQRQFQDCTGPHLVVVPKSTLSNWMTEIRRWGPKLRPLCFHGSKDERQTIIKDLLQPATFNDDARTWDVCVTTYEVCNSDKQILNKFAWNYLIIDEAHRLKNEQSVFSKTVRTFETKYRLLLTGTPLQNNLHEMWALLNFLVPDVFASSEEFDQWFNLDIEDEEKKNMLISQLHKILRPFMLRRLKADVEKSLPPKHETILFVGMSAMQKKLYKDLLMRDLDVLQGKSGNRTALLNIVMQLRKCAGHPYLFPGVEDRTLPPLGNHLVDNCGKMVLLDKLLKKLKENGHRVLLFTQMTRILDILEDYLVMRQYQYCRIDGNTSYDEREERIDAFNAPDSEKFLFLLSTRAGGLGINLQTADIVILYDSDWNPQADLQAQDRAHRIGQKREVQVFRLVTEHTIEEKIVERAQQKLKLDAMVVQQGRLQGAEKMSRDTLLDAVRFGADKIFKSKESSITDDDIDLILNIGKQRTEELNEKLQKADKGNMLDFKLDGSITGTQTFEGVDYSKLGQSQAEIFGILELGKRERRQVAYNEDQLSRQMTGPKKEKTKEPKLPRFLRLPRMEEWQMFDREALYALQEEEEQAFKSLTEEQQKIPVKAWAAALLRRDMGKPEESEGDDQSDPSNEVPRLLTEEQEKEKRRLLAEGFPDWSRHHYLAFLRACGKFGRGRYDKIAEEVGKSEQLVRDYSKAFWDKNIGKKRFSDHEYDRVVKTIERGEKKLEDALSLERCTATLISLFENPWTDLEINHTQFKDKAFSAEEDRYLLCWTHKFGYGQWEAIKLAIRRSPAFRFDYFLRSLPIEALGKRCEQLMKAAEREVEVLEKAAREELGLPTKEQKDENGAIIPLPPVKLPMYKEMKAKKLLEAEREYENQRAELETKVEDIESEIENLQRRLRELEEYSKEGTSSQRSFHTGEVPDDLIPELVNLVATSGASSIVTVASEFCTRYPGKMTKKQVTIKIEEIAKKEKREDEGDTKVVWHIKDDYSHLLDVETLRYLRKEKQKRIDSPQNRRRKGRNSRRRSTPEDEHNEEETPQGPPSTFPDYDPSEPPKEAKKMFTHFCIQSRRDVKASLHPEERKDKHKIHALLKERWNSVSDREKDEVWIKWQEWDERRYESELSTYEKSKSSANKRDKQEKSASTDEVHIPKKKKRVVSY